MKMISKENIWLNIVLEVASLGLLFGNFDVSLNETKRPTIHIKIANCGIWVLLIIFHK